MHHLKVNNSITNSRNIRIKTVSEAGFKVRSHRHQYESEYQYTGSKKHVSACISMAVVHIDTSSVQVVFISKPCEVKNTKFVLI